MPFPGEFAGTLDDVESLDYLHYEGLGYPSPDCEDAALVWGSVLAKQLGMVWVAGPRGELLLMHDAPGSRITIWPYARVLESSQRSGPQFGKFAWLLDCAIRDCLQVDLSENAAKWGREVISRWEREGTPWS